MTLAGLLLVTLCAAAALAADSRVVCYYGSWATYRNQPGKYDVENIDTKLCTHLVYGFAGLDAAKGTIKPLDEWNDLEENWGKGAYKRFTALAHRNNMKALLAIGGWNEGSQKYSDMASTAAGRKLFSDSVVPFLQRYNFDGLDMDWEYPSLRGGRPEDKENFVLLLSELSRALHAAGLLLTAAVGASPELVGAAYDVANVAKNVDFLNFMTFDYFTAASHNRTGPASPLDPVPGIGADNYSIKHSVQLWLDAGSPRSKINIAAPMYAQTYQLADAAKNGMGAPITGPGLAGPVSQQSGHLSYFEVCQRLQEGGWTKAADHDSVYAYKGNQWMTYDDPESVQKKAKWVVSESLGGLMIWSLESDDFKGLCGDERNPLLSALNRGLGRL